MTAERSYSDKEVALILRRAMEAQRNHSPESGGTSLGDLRDIARQIGIDPELVADAASSLTLLDQEGGRGLFGNSSHQIKFTHDSPSSPAGLHDVVDGARAIMGHHGSVREILGGVEWKTEGQVSQVVVTARSEPTGTTVQVLTDRSAARALTTMAGVGVGILTAVAIGEASGVGTIGGISLLAGGVGTGLALAQGIWISNSRRFGRKMASLADGIRRRLDSGVEPDREPPSLPSAD